MSISKEDLQYLKYSKSFQESDPVEPPQRAKLHQCFFVEFYLADGTLETYDVNEFLTFYPHPEDKKGRTSVYTKSGKNFSSYIGYTEFAHQFYQALKCNS